MHTTTTAPACELPKPTDPPVLLALLIGSIRAGDRRMATLARGWLADVGIRVSVASDSPLIQAQQAKGGQ